MPMPPQMITTPRSSTPRLSTPRLSMPQMPASARSVRV
jgi:hypothetical protein